VSTKRLRRHAHRPASNSDAERLSLAPLTFEQALKGALATRPAKKAEEEEESDDAVQASDGASTVEP
jgi:hypothetical protein